MCLLSFVACGKTNDTQNGTTETTTLTEAEINQTTEVETTEAETTQTEEIKNNEEKPTGVGEIVEIKEPNKPAATGEFGSSEEFSGIYEIVGYISSTTNDTRHFTLMVKGVDNNNSSTNYDASKTTIPSHVIEGQDHVYLQLIFSNKGLKQWTLIDKYTQVNIGHLSEEELLEHIYPEQKYEEVKMGKINSSNEILLSKCPAGKTYVFDLNVSSDNVFVLPEIINDTNTPVIIVSTKTSKNEDPDREAIVNKSISSNALSFSGGTGDKTTKFYLSVIDGSIDYLLKTEDCFYLSKTEVGSTIDFDFEDFIYNDTGKTAILECEGTTYTLKDGEVIECSWMNDVVLIELQ